MNLRPKFRARPNWKPSSRPQFLRKGKPPVNPCGISLRKKKLVCLPRNTRTQAAAGLQQSGRRLNRLPEWVDPQSYITKGGRHRLFGADYEALRKSAWERAGGATEQNPFSAASCECGCDRPAWWHWDLAPNQGARGELAHNEHGARKSDELDRVKWMRHDCHMKSHNCGGKPITVTKKSLKEQVA